MKSFFLLLALGISLQCLSQDNKSNCPKVFYHSSEIYFDTCQNNITRIGHNVFKKKISIKYDNGKKEFIPLDSLWGLQRRNENQTRLIDGNEYEIRFLSPVIIYAQHHFKSSRYYFSKTLDSPIFPFTTVNIKKQADTLVLDKIVANKKMKRYLE